MLDDAEHAANDTTERQSDFSEPSKEDEEESKGEKAEEEEQKEEVKAIQNPYAQKTAAPDEKADANQGSAKEAEGETTVRGSGDDLKNDDQAENEGAGSGTVESSNPSAATAAAATTSTNSKDQEEAGG